ncbi:MAG: gamma-glutamyltransferase [Paracoccaceae bacterium]
MTLPLPWPRDQWTIRKPATKDPQGVVAAQHVLAAEAGAELLRRGGNAVDAAVAAALALAPVEPWMCGLGGSGFMVIWLAREQRAVALDFQGVLPQALTAADYPVDPELPPTLMGFPAVKGWRNTRGLSAATLPGAVAGLSHAAERFGKLGFAAALEPAIRLAETGIAASWYTTLLIATEAEVIAIDPTSSAIYMPQGRPLQMGAPLFIPELAGTLRRLRDHGAQDFYTGQIAGRLVADMQAGGNRITLDDLASYRVIEADAMQTTHRGATLYTVGPQSGGQRLGDMLAHVAQEMPQPPAQPTPQSWLAYANGLESAWRNHRIKNGTLPDSGAEVGAHTSSLSAADAEGNMVALTYTILDHFGCGVTLPQTGIILNNGVSYFDPRPGLNTTMQGGKRINSSNMCPTVAVRDGQALFAIGASGGDLIMPAVAQVAALMLDFGMTLEEALHSPRLDASHRGSVRADPRLGQAVLDLLAAHHRLEVAQNDVGPKLYAFPSGVAREGGGLSGLSDPYHPDANARGVAGVTPD